MRTNGQGFHRREVAFSVISLSAVVLFPRIGLAEAGMRDLTASLRRSRLSVGDSRSTQTLQADFPLLVTVSLDGQNLSVYRGVERVLRSPISSGKQGHETPTGIFSTLEKRRHHASNIYSDAPMPFMQRLTWSGIALHESGHVPPYPASHGCIRLPTETAKTLFSDLHVGTHVVVAHAELQPRVFRHADLFKAPVVDESLVALRQGFEVVGDDVSSDHGNGDKSPIRVYFTRTSRRDQVRHAQEMLLALGYSISHLDGIAGPETAFAIRQFQEREGEKVTGRFTEQTYEALCERSVQTPIANGLVSIRQNHQTVFEDRVTIDDGTLPLGTHLIIPGHLDGGGLQWISLSLRTRIQGSIRRFHSIEGGIDQPVQTAPEDAFARLKFNERTRQYIEAHLTMGSSIAISDNGFGTETGKGTDFIVQTL